MNRWIVVLLMLASATAAAACGAAPTGPSAPSSSATLNGAWVGTAADSSGSMMGSGMGAVAGTTTWQLTQTGPTFSGTMRVAGSGSVMMVSGIVNGKIGSFTMTMPTGSMMSGGCSSTAAGTFDMDDMMTQLHGTYTGINSCGGPFDHGQMSMMRQ